MHTGIDTDYNSGHIRYMAKKKPIETDTRLEVRLSPHVADQLKNAAKETGVSLNQLMKSICIWTASNMKTGKPTVINDTVVGSSQCDGMFWLGQTEDEDGAHGGDVYAVFDFSTNRAIRNPAEFFHSEEML